jgi:hypothetical protein
MTRKYALHCALYLAICSGVYSQIPDFTPATPLLGATLSNNKEAAAKLLLDGADPNEARFFGFTPLHLAAMYSNRDIAKLLLDKGADLHAVDGNGNTAPMWALGTDYPNPALLDDLLARGADPNVKNKLGETAMQWAMRRGNMQAVERLRKAGVNDAAAVKQSVEKAVALMQKSGPQFVKVSGCVSCHHQSLPQMAYGAARTRGYAVDETISAQQVKSVLAMFRPVKEKLADGSIHLPSPGITVSYSLLGLHAEGYAPDSTTSAMTMAIARMQQPDGSFAQAPIRAPLESSPFTSTALSVRALQLYGENSEGAIEKARQWLSQAKPFTNEDRAMRLLGLTWSKAGKHTLHQAAADLLTMQRADGGWAQLDGIETDAYATGQAMVALITSGKVSANDPAYQRAIAYLLRTQYPDGSWLVRTRSTPFQPLKDSGFPHDRNQWISMAGTSWAAMALTLSQQPAAGEHPSGEGK